ncbi:MAG: c-type cytochrome [Rhizobiaceae bacterium]|nr:c-type cytochrome [Rhizobiaceae bacterium]MCV0405388.1 c-type cytochrome [Rhizobiaceae bacterium]
MSKYPEVLVAAALGLLAATSSAGAQDAAAGEKVFARCKACHAVGEGAANRVGPHLNGVVGRAAGAIEGYKYSPAMTEKAGEGLVWDEPSLTRYLENPRGFLKGTKMAFAGLKKPQEIADIIAYLATFAEDGSQKAAQADPAGDDGGRDAAGAAETDTAEAAGEAEEEPSQAGADAAPRADEPTASSVASGSDGLKFGLGREATDDEVAAWDIDIRPDGKGLPEGRGTVGEGMIVYDQQCASCHGDFGEAIGRWPVLAGGQGTLRDERPEKTIGSYWPYLSTVYDYVRRAMPFGDARSLSDDEVYALTAYLLYLNDIVGDEEFELSRENFTSIDLPNEQNFIDDDRASEAHYADRSEPCMSDCKEGAPEITMHAAVLDVTPEDSDEKESRGGGID